MIEVVCSAADAELDDDMRTFRLQRYRNPDFAPPFVAVVVDSESWVARMWIAQTVGETQYNLPPAIRELDIVSYGKKYGYQGLNFAICGGITRILVDVSDLREEILNVRAGPEEYGEPIVHEFIHLCPTNACYGSAPNWFETIKYGVRVDGKWTFEPFITVSEADREDVTLALDANHEGYPDCIVAKMHSRNAISDTLHDDTIDVEQPHCNMTT